jgi:hypothetical protein
VNPEDGRLKIIARYNTAPYFQHVRGSANPILSPDGKSYLALVHTVKYDTPRKYFHHLVTLDKTTLRPTRISLPFYFETLGIEYCIGVTTRPYNKLLFVYSTFDAEPRRFEAPMELFSFIDL